MTRSEHSQLQQLIEWDDQDRAVYRPKRVKPPVQRRRKKSLRDHRQAAHA